MEEIWKEVPSLDGYLASNFGQVKMLEHYSNMPNGGVKHHKEKIKPQETSRNGYLRVKCYKDGKMKRYSVHRLVAMAFLPNPNNYPQVNHKDENKSNNTVWVNEDGSIDQEKSNLEWCSSEYNHNYGSRNQRAALKNVNGKKSKSVLQYDLDGKLIKQYPSIAEATRNGFDGGGIWQCCNNKIKQYKGYIWKYAD